jgi:hypothetical protein
MQAPMSPKFRKHLANPKNASKLTEQILLSGKSDGKFSIQIDNQKVNIRQIGMAK